MLLLSMLLVAASVPAEPSMAAAIAPPPPRWQVALAVVSGTPAVLPGLAVGGAGELSRRLGVGPWFVCGQLSLASASGANESWTIDHRQMALVVGLGAATDVGVGHLWAEAGGGLLGLEEILGRHQLERIQLDGIGGGTVTSYALGPLAFAEVGISLALRAALHARLSGGPVASRLDLADGPTWRLGAMTKLGIGYDF